MFKCPREKLWWSSLFSLGVMSCFNVSRNYRFWKTLFYGHIFFYHLLVYFYLEVVFFFTKFFLFMSTSPCNCRAGLYLIRVPGLKTWEMWRMIGFLIGGHQLKSTLIPIDLQLLGFCCICSNMLNLYNLVDVLQAGK